ncbi:MAG: hypothetical protein ABIY46_06710, partial [Gemmatimonadales bacterium]
MPHISFLSAARPPLLATAACSLLLVLPLAAQQPMLPVPTQGLAGQEVAVVPLTLVATDPAFQGDTIF